MSLSLPFPRQTISVENRQFSHPRVFNAAAEVVRLGIGHRRKGQKN